MSDIYIKLSTLILDDPKIAVLNDRDWCEYIKSILNNPNNHFCDPGRIRKSWLKVRNKMRKLVLERDDNSCRICGSIEYLEIDHIKPLARGGSNDLNNLQILCRKHNREKWANE
jgi:5-methylcytosine-specific restriction endonuclease McrA